MLNDGYMASENPGWLCVVIKVMDAKEAVDMEEVCWHDIFGG